MRTVCPTCKEPKDVPDAYKGREVKCESCKTTFIAISQPLIINHKPQLQPQSPSNFWRPGLYLQVIGIMGLIGISWWGYIYDWDSTSQHIVNIYGFNQWEYKYSESDRFLMSILISGITRLGALLSFVLIGLGSIVKNLQKKKINFSP